MASVLKSDRLQHGTSAAQPVSFNIQDLQSRAREYLMEVQQQAEEILDSAKRQAAKLQTEARWAGVKEAKAEIEKQIEDSAARMSDARCRTAIAACQKSVEQLSESTASWLSHWRNQTIELACRIAEKLVRSQVCFDNELLRVWMEEALVSMRDEREVRILVNPEDFSLAGRFLQSLAQTIPHASSATVLPDPSIQRGGCVVRSKHGHIDQQLESQLRRLAEQLGSGQEVAGEN